MRKDGMPFYGATVNIKYHDTEQNFIQKGIFNPNDDDANSSSNNNNFNVKKQQKMVVDKKNIRGGAPAQQLKGGLSSLERLKQRYSSDNDDY